MIDFLLDSDAETSKNNLIMFALLAMSALFHTRCLRVSDPYTTHTTSTPNQYSISSPYPTLPTSNKPTHIQIVQHVHLRTTYYRTRSSVYNTFIYALHIILCGHQYSMHICTMLSNHDRVCARAISIDQARTIPSWRCLQPSPRRMPRCKRRATPQRRRRSR